ncbi:hypothetical protein EV647_7901 [Kribbella sp. VKM Ac-2566]|nr:hypothetical protein EV647_7901 [Kribbella sp. VKM Ac-2566]
MTGADITATERPHTFSVVDNVGLAAAPVKIKVQVSKVCRAILIRFAQ